MKRLVLLLLILIACWALPAQAGDGNWIVGKWELSHDPDGGKKDWLEFTQDGRAYGTSPEGVRIPGIFQVKGDEVRVVLRYHGKSLLMLLGYAPDRKMLLYYSQNSRHTAEYRKVERALSAGR